MPANPTYTDSELIRLLAAGNTSAFEVVYNRYFNSVFYFAKRFFNDPSIAEDITSETFIKLWNRYGDFENLHKLQSFLFVTTRNACINVLRDEKRKSASQPELLHLLSQESQEATAVQQLTGTIYQYIYEEIEKLPPQEKLIFKLSYIEGLSNEEIALQLAITNQSVRNSKTRALKTLRLALADKDIYTVLLGLLLCPTAPSTC